MIMAKKRRRIGRRYKKTKKSCILSPHDPRHEVNHTVKGKRKCREFMYIYWRGVDAHRLRTVRKKYKSHRRASRLLQPVMMSSDLVFEDSR